MPPVVSLFCGAGGLDLGFKQSGFRIAAAIDSSSAAIKTHARNFPRTHSVEANLATLGAPGVRKEVETKMPSGAQLGVIGGPPCQGFSRANTGAQADDPRNNLPSLYLDIIAELQATFNIRFVVFENVLGIRDKKHLATFTKIVAGLERLDFIVSQHELCAIDFAVPQNRRRIILVGIESTPCHDPVQFRRRAGARTVRDAIEGLPEPLFFRRDLSAADITYHPNHWTMKPRSGRFSRLAPESTPHGRSFKVLDWDKPSPTVAYGNREIHIHPEGHRRLSIFEAMQLQGFPRDFVLEGNLSEQVEQVSNAVPPPVGRTIANAIRRSLRSRSILPSAIPVGTSEDVR